MDKQRSRFFGGFGKERLIMELYKKYRPKTLKAVVGQDSAVAELTSMLAKEQGLPHCLLFSGPSGCGKTTVARILQTVLECGAHDFFEINCADFKGIEMVREIRQSCNLAPMSGSCKIWLIDECHRLTSDAQNALLKLLEDTPRHVYFFLATTDPQKLIKTIHTRAFQVKLGALSVAALEQVLRRVCEKEGLEISEDVVDEIIQAAEGSARKALVILEQVSHAKGEDAQLKAIQTTTFNKDGAIELARLLVFGKGGWLDVAKVLRSLGDQDAEGIRYCVLGYARSVLIGKEDKAPNMKLAERAFLVIDVFSRNFYDSKQAGLAGACWEVMNP